MAIVKFRRIRKRQKTTKISEEKFLILADRLKRYIDFLVRNAPQKDYEVWNDKFVRVLKFLGDYKVDSEV